MSAPRSPSQEVLLSVIDAFAAAPFQGNPAAVCLLPGGMDCYSAWMQKMAAELVTGLAHCALAPSWAKKLGKTSLVAYQASARGRELQLRVDAERVLIGGSAVTVWNGALRATA